MLLEYLPQAQTLVVGWYTFDFADAAGDGSQSALWLTAAGTAAGNAATLPVVLTEGGGFDSGQPVQRVTIGTLTLRPRSCTQIDVDYDLTINGQRRTGSLLLSRLTPDSLCRPATGGL
jgi:hypothetical protein